MSRHFKTVRELIHREYAKLMAGSAVGNRLEFRFIEHCYQRLVHGRIHPSTILRENLQLIETGERCAYCDSSASLEWDHVIPDRSAAPTRSTPSCVPAAVAPPAPGKKS